MTSFIKYLSTAPVILTIWMSFTSILIICVLSELNK